MPPPRIYEAAHAERVLAPEYIQFLQKFRLKSKPRVPGGCDRRMSVSGCTSGFVALGALKRISDALIVSSDSTPDLAFLPLRHHW